jgi:glucose/arabinose dehydrogenase
MRSVRLRRGGVAVLAALGVLVVVAVAVALVHPPIVLERLGWYTPARDRLVTGILVVGTASRPALYVTSSDPRGASGRTERPDTNSGVISRLDRASSGWRRLDLVRGLPRSARDHATNGMALDHEREVLYVAQGANTNRGAPSRFFGRVPEYALSGAVLAVDIGRIGDATYDLPTLDDEDRAGSPDRNDPFGGNGGKNQAMVPPPGAPVRLHATGLRNSYDLVLTARGRLFTVQNGPNDGAGGLPAGEGSRGVCTHEPREGGRSDLDTLHLVVRGRYYGHPNPTRGNAASLARDSRQNPLTRHRAEECDYLPSYRQGGLATFDGSTNGIAEYRAGNHAGVLRGDLLAVSLRGELRLIRLDATGGRVTGQEHQKLRGVPLDVTTQDDGHRFPGTVWVAHYAVPGREGQVTVLEPTDFAGGAAQAPTPGSLLRRGFVRSRLVGAEPQRPTSLQFGPDGRLYVALQNGTILAYTIERHGPRRYEVVSTERIAEIRTMPNHDDDGSSATDVESMVATLGDKLAEKLGL